jgi:hypothetical protein
MNRIGRLLVMVAWTLAWVLPAGAQESTGPLSQDQLREALKAGGLSGDELSAIIKRRGVNFEMSVDLERRLREAGADSVVVLAAWEKEQWNPPKGDPLTKDFLTALLQTNTPPQRLSKWIVARKVNFELTPAAVKDLQSAGATDQVLAVVTTNNIWRKATYEEVMTAAREALKAGKYDVAESQADAAKLLDASRPEAFALIGYVYLYHFESFSKAASEYRSAIDKNGEVEFRVRHIDKVTKLGKVETCVGQLLLKKGSLVFRSSLAAHNLDLKGNQLVEARLSGPSAKTPLARNEVRLLASRGGGRPSEIQFQADRSKNAKDEESIIADLINVIRQ